MGSKFKIKESIFETKIKWRQMFYFKFILLYFILIFKQHLF